jgi:thioredoxin 1
MKMKHKIIAAVFTALIVSLNPVNAASKIETISHGAPVNIGRHLAAGKITLVDFYADWCGPCRMISPYLASLATSNPQITLRKIDIVRWNTPVCQQYQIGSVPQVWVYNKRGALVGRVVGVNVGQVNALIAQAR